MLNPFSLPQMKALFPKGEGMRLNLQEKRHKIPIAPAGDPAFNILYDTCMRWPILRARMQVAAREKFQSGIGIPVERGLLRWWMLGYPGSEFLECYGLPRRAIESYLGNSLILHVNPRELIRSTDWRGYSYKLRPSSSAFIWGGEWDVRRGDLRFGTRYRFISELDEHRNDLTRTERFAQLATQLNAGRPWTSHQQGVLLNSRERILAYLHVYLGFLDDMAKNGFDETRGKDELGVAVSREGRLLKINRGLHRLAMAQRLGLASVPVRVRAVHREWWYRTIGEAKGWAALERAITGLKGCVPETQPGELDPVEWTEAFKWPAARVVAYKGAGKEGID
ncbi:hypothetical protein HNO53_09380 [Billgrantia antri]|uniref:Uncharacterized protein n=1 Tax=Halomonas sulfidivorans TaxID=2733488 RepID=A0ABX7WER4_9GAMM|nr:hypothetical protein [Halomonas sulfidivorans]QTP58898.1 hypothetical protein HNO53_09380 [Halomonas sulfidivorans]